MDIVWLPKALENLKEILSYTKKENPSIAKKVALQIKKTIHILNLQPQIGRPSMVDGFREISISKYPYIIPYKVVNEKIIIVRVFHAKQNRDNFYQYLTANK